VVSLYIFNWLVNVFEENMNGVHCFILQTF
jgi:hypothetical protein